MVWPGTQYPRDALSKGCNIQEIRSGHIGRGRIDIAPVIITPATRRNNLGHYRVPCEPPRTMFSDTMQVCEEHSPVKVTLPLKNIACLVIRSFFVHMLLKLTLNKSIIFFSSGPSQ
jgi:hypothetical protein